MNKQHLLERKLEADGRVLYVFRRNPEIWDLIREWEVKSPYETALVRYSTIVSFEIRKAIRMRREAGVPLRLRSTDKG